MLFRSEAAPRVDDVVVGRARRLHELLQQRRGAVTHCNLLAAYAQVLSQRLPQFDGEHVGVAVGTARSTHHRLCRSRQRLWTKGETSGHHLRVVALEADCDADTILVLAHPRGPTCHLQRPSCFPDAPAGVLAELDALIATRARERPEGSYTTRLFEGGIRRIAQKVGEEGVETALAGVVQEDEALLGESADLLYHLIVLLRARDLSLTDVERVLRTRGG